MRIYRHRKSQHRNKLRANSKSSWEKIVIIASVITALSAAFTVYQSHDIWKKQLYIGRPYFNLQNPHFNEILPKDHFEFVVTLKNVGTRPAVEIKILIVGIKEDFNFKPYKEYRAKFSNPISPSEEPTIRIPVGNFQIPEPSHQFYIKIISYDQFVDAETVQKFYLTWPGINDSSAVISNLDHMTIDEQQKFARDFELFLSY